MVRLNEVKTMNLKEIIAAKLLETANFDNEDDIAQHIVDAIEPELRVIIEMRYAQRSYFRRRTEDNLSKAKRLEILVDLKLLPFDTKRNIPVQIDAFPSGF